MTTILVSGGTGFVGRFIVEGFLAAGHKVLVWGRTPPEPGFFSAPVGFVAGKLDPEGDHMPAFSGVDTFIHAAFEHLPGKYRGGEGDDPENFVRRNHLGSTALFSAAKRASVGRVVFLSSRAVYGPHPLGSALDETSDLRPDTLYGVVKRDAELDLLALRADDFVPVILRVTGVYGAAGPGRAHKWDALFQDFRAGKPVPARAGTEVHGADVAAAVRLALTTPAEKIGDGVFNVSDVLVDTRDILSIHAAAAGLDGLALPPAADKETVNAMATGRVSTLGWRPGGTDLFERTVRDLSQPALLRPR